MNTLLSARPLSIVAALTLAIAALPAATASAAPSAPTATTTYIVSYSPSTDARGRAALAAASGVRVGHVYARALNGMSVDLTPAQRAALASDPAVIAIEPDAPVRAFATQTDAPWGLDRIDQAKLPLSGTFTPGGTGAGVKAYVIDSGAYAAHADFGGRVASGFDVVDGGAPDDCHGHGTHVAGTIAGATFGVAKQATIVPVRVLNCAGEGSTSGIIAALDWVVADHGSEPAVANMSLGGGASQAMDAAVQAVIADGVTLSVAAGNDFAMGCVYSPARVKDAITVSASTKFDRPAAFSSTGPCVDLFAPGEGILSAGISSPTASRVMSGTSMAAPHVTGAAAIVVGQHPTWTPAQVTAQLLKDATRSVLTGVDRETPNRLLNVR